MIPDKATFIEVIGEPASKANSRKIVMFGKKPAIIKSQKARDYVKNFEKQVQKLPEFFRRRSCCAYYYLLRQQKT